MHIARASPHPHSSRPSERLRGNFNQSTGQTLVSSNTYSVLTVAGSVTLSGGSISISGSGAAFCVGDETPSTFELASGVVSLNEGAQMHVTGSFDYVGGIFFMEDATLIATDGFNISSGMTFSGTGTIVGDVINAGAWTVGDPYESPVTLSITGNVTLDGSTLSLLTGGELDVSGDFLQDDGWLHLAGAALLTVSGDFHQTSGDTYVFGPGSSQTTLTVGGSFTLDAGTVTVGMDALLDVAGAVTVFDGLLLLEYTAYLTAGSGVVIQADGRLSAAGTITGNVTNAGMLDISTWPSGTLSIVGNFTQTSTGTFKAQLDAYDTYDQLHVSGQATLNGAFVMTLQPGAAPYSGPYSILSYGSRSGTFSSLSLPELSSSYTWDWLYDSSVFSLWVEFDI